MLTNIILVSAVTASGCAPVSPLWRDKAISEMVKVNGQGAQMEFPSEYENADETLKSGEVLLREDDVKEADDYFRLAFIKGKILEKALADLKASRDEKLRISAEAEKIEADRLVALKEAELRAEQSDRDSAAGRGPERSRTVKERPLPESHTVKKGETLPLIAARADVYNDYRLWPLLYRANRDQIRDPKHVWPGQILRIPRNLTREEMNEARRYAQEKPIH